MIVTIALAALATGSSAARGPGWEVQSQQSFGLRQSAAPSGKEAGWAWKQEHLHHEPEVQPENPNAEGNHAWSNKHAAPFAPHMVGQSTKTLAGKAVEKAVEEDNQAAEAAAKKMNTLDTASLRSTIGDGAGSSSGVQGLADSARNMKLKDFLPRCTKRVRTLIIDIDNNYGDAQLHTNLQNYCAHGEEFPASHGDGHGFRESVSCQQFAEDLTSVRMEELRTNSQKGYTDFCTAFYQHHGGFAYSAPARKSEPRAPKKSSSQRLTEPVLATIAMVAAALAAF